MGSDAEQKNELHPNIIKLSDTYVPDSQQKLGDNNTAYPRKKSTCSVMVTRSCGNIS